MATHLTNPENIPQPLIDALLDDFERLTKWKSDVFERVVRFVVDGEDAAVLTDVASPRASGLLQLEANGGPLGGWGPVSHHRKLRKATLSSEHDAPTSYWLRLARVFDAVSSASRLTCSIPAGWPTWAGILLKEIAGLGAGAHADEDFSWPLERIEAMLEADGHPTGIAGQLLLWPEIGQDMMPESTGFCWQWMEKAFTGWEDFWQRHPEVIRECLTDSAAKLQAESLAELRKRQLDLSQLADLLVDFATGKTKGPRQEAEGILNDAAYHDAVRPLLEEKLEKGAAHEREHATRLLNEFFAGDVTELFTARLEAEKSKIVRELLEKFIAAAPAAGDRSEPATAAPEVPPLSIPLGVVPLDDKTKALLRKNFFSEYESLVFNYKEKLDRWTNDPQARGNIGRKPEPPKEFLKSHFDHLIRFVEGREPVFFDSSQVVSLVYRNSLVGFGGKQLELIHFMRLHHVFENLCAPRFEQIRAYEFDMAMQRWHRACSKSFGLREANAAFNTLPGAETDYFLRLWLRRSADLYFPFLNGWDEELVWPAFVGKETLLRDGLADAVSFNTSCDVIAMLPEIPAICIDALWDIALGELKGGREVAQDIVADQPDRDDRIRAALSSGKQEIRFAAATWLGRLGEPAGIEPLKDRFRKEKQEIVKGAIMSSLDLLEADISEFFNPDALLAEAQKGLKKGLPKDAAWVPIDSLPPVRWQDSGEQVEPDIVKWWVVQSIKQKTPACGALLRRSLSLCHDDDAIHLARSVLLAWMTHDTRPFHPDEKSARAAEQADALWKRITEGDPGETFPLPHGVGFAHEVSSRKELYELLFKGEPPYCADSAIKQKGMLAIVSAAGDAECASMALKYLRKWYGTRLAQSKALLEMLSWIEDRMAMQALMEVANGFRTRSLQTLASELVDELAERRGWTREDLEDRTIPTAGFELPVDEDGQPVPGDAVLLLDYGPRQFAVTLDDDLQPVITKPDGKTQKSLPKSNDDDDVHSSQDSQRRFKEAKRQLKETIKAQTQRLFTAMCTQRSWQLDAWQRDLAEHPIAASLCNRLVWTVWPAQSTTKEPGELTGTFRRLADGSFADANDGAVELPPDTVLRLAHSEVVSWETDEAWQQHLSEHGVAPLLPQFGRSVEVSGEERDAEADMWAERGCYVSTGDYDGWMISALKLKSMARKLGWYGGQTDTGSEKVWS